MESPFRLQPVLNHRKFLEEQAQKAFTDAGIAVQAARETLRSMKHRREQYQAELRQQQQACRYVSRIVLNLQYLERLGKEIQSQEVALNELETDREAKRQLLLEAVKERKVIEKLKEKQAAVRFREANQKERRQMDDLSVTRYAAEEPDIPADADAQEDYKSKPTGKSFRPGKSLPADARVSSANVANRFPELDCKPM